LIEVKCPFSARFCERPEDVVKLCKFLQMSPEGSVLLNKSSNYYYQVVMQLHVSGRQWCDFIVWTQGSLSPDNNPSNPAGVIIVFRVNRDHETLAQWELMVPKLLKFYRTELAPEITDSRFFRNMGYRQPEHRLNAIRFQQEKSRKRKVNQQENEKNKQDIVPSARRRLDYNDDCPVDTIQATIDATIEQARQYHRGKACNSNSELQMSKE